MEISGKHALVTGAGAGIGRATVIALVQKGAKVVAADINEDGLKETAALAQQAVSGALQWVLKKPLRLCVHVAEAPL